MEPIRLLVADDHEIVRRGIRSLLEAQPGWLVTGEASDGREAVEKARDLKPDVTVLDISMPSLNGLEAARQMIDQKAIADLRPDRYLSASRKYSREAFDALRKGNVKAAAEAKNKELLNHFLFREASAGRQNGRTVEIQRLIGRSLRTIADLKALGERQITIDCDVIQADGGTRTASITGAWIALYDCLAWMKTRDMLAQEVLRDHIAAISCGVCGGVAVLDLDYAEDSQAETDANFVLTGSGNIVEIQATAEKTPFSEEQFSALLALARKGVTKLVDLQKMAVM